MNPASFGICWNCQNEKWLGLLCSGTMDCATTI
jgi:hypothetical protein